MPFSPRLTYSFFHMPKGTPCAEDKLLAVAQDLRRLKFVESNESTTERFPHRSNDGPSETTVPYAGSVTLIILTLPLKAPKKLKHFFIFWGCWWRAKLNLAALAYCRGDPPPLFSNWGNQWWTHGKQALRTRTAQSAAVKRHKNDCHFHIPSGRLLDATVRLFNLETHKLQIKVDPFAGSS